MAQQASQSKEIITTTNDTSAVVSYQVNGQEISLSNAAVRQLTNNNQYITNGEIELFISWCKFNQLNPFTREAYLVKYDDKKPAQQITALGAFTRIADSQSDYEGMEDGIIVYTSDGKIVDRVGCTLYPNERLLGGWAKAYRRNRRFPSIARLSLKEYSKGQSTWNAMPCVMINKCAKVAALRALYPSAYQNMYEEDELKMSGGIDARPNTPLHVDAENKEPFYDIVDNVCEDVVVQEAITPEMPNIDDGSNQEPTGEVKEIPYGEYKDHQDLYKPYGENPYNEVTHKIRVIVKE